MNLYKNFYELMEDRSKFHGKESILSFIQGDTLKSWSYSELDQRARCIAVYLTRLHLRPKARVLLLLDPGLDYVAAYLGCLYAGLVAVPLFPPSKHKQNIRIQAVFQNSAAEVAITTSDVSLANLPIIHTLFIDQLDIRAAEEFRAIAMASEDITFLQYTSGSTAAPKAAMVSHQNILANCQAMYERFYRPDMIKVGCSWVPPYHDMGLIGGILFPLYAGFHAILFSPQRFAREPLYWLKVMNDYKINISLAPNFAYDLCVKEINKKPEFNVDLSSVSVLINGSEPIYADSIEKFQNAFEKYGLRKNVIYPCFGLAEATLLVTSKNLNEINKILWVNKDKLSTEKHAVLDETSPNQQAFVSCGKIIKDHDLKIKDPEYWIEKKPYEVGEIWLKGPSIILGYWHHEKENKEAFQEGYYRTGDLGFIDAERNLYITGRIKDVIIIRGKNYYPQDIEKSIQQAHVGLVAHGGAVFSVYHENREHLVVVQEVQRHEKNYDEIFAAIREVVSIEYELSVDKIILIQQASLLKTSSGKIRRQACKEAFLTAQLKISARWDSPRSFV